MVSWSLLEALSHRGGNTCSWQLLPLGRGTKFPPATPPGQMQPNSASSSVLFPKSFEKTGTEEARRKKAKLIHMSLNPSVSIKLTKPNPIKTKYELD